MSVDSLELIVPAWYRPEREGGPPSDEEPSGGIEGLHWERTDVTTWQGVLMNSLGLDSGNGAEVPGANAWVEDFGGDFPAFRCLRADPVHLAADRDTALIHPPQALFLDPEESAALVASLDGFLAEDGLGLRAAGTSRWYLAALTVEAGAALPLRSHFPAERLARLRASDFLEPHAGADGACARDTSDAARAQRRLRSLESELEMLLHAHPVNEARRSAGRLTVTGLHFWGATRPWISLPDNDADRGGGAPRTDAVVATDPFARAAARAADALLIDAHGFAALSASAGGSFGPGRAFAASDAPAETPSDTRIDAAAHVSVVDLSIYDAWLAGDAEAERAARQRITADWVEPAARAFRHGMLSAFVIAGDDGEHGTVDIAAARRSDRGLLSWIGRWLSRRQGRNGVADRDPRT